MKKLLLVFMGVLCLIINLEAQDVLNPTPILDQLTVPDSVFSFEQTGFVKAWNWDSPHAS